MNTIKTNGIYYLNPLDGTGDWRWGMDYTCGDLYEAEEVYRLGHPMKPNRVIFVRVSDGCIIEPIQAAPGQHLGHPPLFRGGMICQLLVDFVQEEIRILCFNPDIAAQNVALPGAAALDAVSPSAAADQQSCAEATITLPLSIAKDCYNLMLHTEPLMLTRQTENRFQILWSEEPTSMELPIDFLIGEHEAFVYRAGEKLYFSSWQETETPEYDYREAVIIRSLAGETLETRDGALFEVSPGNYWILE